MEDEKIPDLSVILAAVLLKAENQNLEFRRLYKRLLIVTMQSQAFWSMEDVQSAVFADSVNWFLTVRKTENGCPNYVSFPVALFITLGTLQEIRTKLIMTICNCMESGDPRILQYLQEAYEIVDAKLTAEQENQQKSVLKRKGVQAEESTSIKQPNIEFDPDLPSVSSHPMSNSSYSGISNSFIPSLPNSPPVFRIPHFLPNLVVGHAEFQLIPIGPASVELENDPNFVTFFYEKVDPVSRYL